MPGWTQTGPLPPARARQLAAATITRDQADAATAGDGHPMTVPRRGPGLCRPRWIDGLRGRGEMADTPALVRCSRGVWVPVLHPAKSGPLPEGRGTSFTWLSRQAVGARVAVGGRTKPVPAADGLPPRAPNPAGTGREASPPSPLLPPRRWNPSAGERGSAAAGARCAGRVTTRWHPAVVAVAASRRSRRCRSRWRQRRFRL